MSQVYYFTRKGRSVLYQITSFEKHWFEGEILHPYPGLKFDYFTEEEYFTPKRIEDFTREILDHCFVTLESIFSSFNYLQEISAKFCNYNRRYENERGYIREFVTEPYLEDFLNTNIDFCKGKTIRSSLARIITKALVSPSNNLYPKPEYEFDAVYKDILRQSKTIRTLN